MRYRFFALFGVIILLSGLALYAHLTAAAAATREYNQCSNVLKRAVKNQSDVIQIYFNDPFLRDSHEMEKVLACRLRAAQTSIDAHFYQANLLGIRDELIAAHKRGVRVRFITDDHYYFHPNYYPIFYTPLAEAGIFVAHDQLVKHTNGQSHNKFAVIDKEYVWTGSFNITSNGAFLNANNALFIHSPEIAADYTAEFDEMWGDSETSLPNLRYAKFGNKKLRNTINDHLVPGIGRVEICFDPSDGCLQRTLDAINTAQYSIHFAAFSFTDDAMSDLILKKMEEGVRIEGLFHQAECRYGEYPKLKAASPDTIYLRSDLSPRPRLIHHKFILIDVGTDSDPIVITGSRNFSQSSEKKNDENMLIIHNADIAGRYLSGLRAMLRYIKNPSSLAQACERKSS